VAHVLAHPCSPRRLSAYDVRPTTGTTTSVSDRFRRSGIMAPGWLVDPSRPFCVLPGGFQGAGAASAARASAVLSGETVPGQPPPRTRSNAPTRRSRWTSPAIRPTVARRSTGTPPSSAHPIPLSNRAMLTSSASVSPEAIRASSSTPACDSTSDGFRPPRGSRPAGCHHRATGSSASVRARAVREQLPLVLAQQPEPLAGLPEVEHRNGEVFAVALPDLLGARSEAPRHRGGIGRMPCPPLQFTRHAERARRPHGWPRAPPGSVMRARA
jgi:hypothetical protein